MKEIEETERKKEKKRANDKSFFFSGRFFNKIVLTVNF